jgi:hypothetical protein
MIPKTALAGGKARLFSDWLGLSALQKNAESTQASGGATRQKWSKSPALEAAKG